MSAVIWWLESPWQLRVFVFLLSFFVCIVAPWLHNQGLPIRPALKKPADAAPPIQLEQVVRSEVQAPNKAAVHPEVQAEAPIQRAEQLAPHAVQAPVQAAASPQKAEGQPQQPAVAPAPASQQVKAAFSISKKTTSGVAIPAGAPVEKQEFTASSESGGIAQVDVHLLQASWKPGRFDQAVDAANRRVNLLGLLDKEAFAKEFSLYDTLICVGLGSKGNRIGETTRLTSNRASHLCGLLSQKRYIGKHTKVYGLPLGWNLDATANPPEKERIKRSIIIIGIKSAKGDLADTKVQKKLISELIASNKVENVKLGKYSEPASGKLRYVEVKRGKPMPKRVQQLPPLELDSLLPLDELDLEDAPGEKIKLHHRRHSRGHHRYRHRSCAIGNRSVFVANSPSQPEGDKHRTFFRRPMLTADQLHDKVSRLQPANENSKQSRNALRDGYRAAVSHA